MYYHRTKHGFTLIELLVVIAIIGILAAVVLASLNSARERARNASITSQLKEYEKALELYYANAGTYPITAAAYCLGEGYSGANCWHTGGTSNAENTAFKDALRPYLPSLPPIGVDEGAYRGAVYWSVNGGQGYRIQYVLEGAGLDCDVGTAWSPQPTNNYGKTYCTISR